MIYCDLFVSNLFYKEDLVIFAGVAVGCVCVWVCVCVHGPGVTEHSLEYTGGFKKKETDIKMLIPWKGFNILKKWKPSYISASYLLSINTKN